MKAPGLIAREVYAKYINGDSIGDTELAIAAMYFDELSDKLTPLGDVFRLPANEAYRIADALGGFLAARQEKRK